MHLVYLNKGLQSRLAGKIRDPARHRFFFSNLGHSSIHFERKSTYFEPIALNALQDLNFEQYLVKLWTWIKPIYLIKYYTEKVGKWYDNMRNFVVANVRNMLHSLYGLEKKSSKWISVSHNLVKQFSDETSKTLKFATLSNQRHRYVLR